VVKKNVL